MEFRLLYQGPLKAATKDKTRASEKHELRRQFHKQLRRLWFTNPNLRRLGHQVGTIASTIPPVSFVVDKDNNVDYFLMGLNHLCKRWQHAGYSCIPLVTEDLCLRCSLDVLFLRPSDSGTLVQGGDLDNRLKTLFDGLRLPSNRAEVANEYPTDEETPFFCLLQDDKLISEINVTTDNLLLLPGERELKTNDVYLVITVKLASTIPHVWNWVF